MQAEKSCGAVVYTEIEQEIHYLLIQHMNGGHWAYPKGHVEANETEEETALREIQEETGLSVILDPAFRDTVVYSPKENVTKEVVYFVAKANQNEVQRQEIEVVASEWLPYEAARERLTYPNDQLILEKVKVFLNSANKPK